jgi:hypothetical protein
VLPRGRNFGCKTQKGPKKIRRQVPEKSVAAFLRDLQKKAEKEAALCEV